MPPETSARTPPESGRGRLRRMIADQAFKEGDFVLSSGRRSNVFFNLKPVMLDPEGLNLLADQVIARTAECEARYIGGLAMGAVPIVIAVVAKSHGTPRPLKGFWVRKDQKAHGMRQRIDGDPEPGSRVIIVEDVTTTGESVLTAVRAAEERGCTVACVLTVVDRCEGARERLGEQGYDLVSIFERYDFTSKRPDDAA